jgi:hypothetical protein
MTCSEKDICDTLFEGFTGLDDHQANASIGSLHLLYRSDVSGDPKWPWWHTNHQRGKRTSAGNPNPFTISPNEWNGLFRSVLSMDLTAFTEE